MADKLLQLGRTAAGALLPFLGVFVLSTSCGGDVSTGGPTDQGFSGGTGGAASQGGATSAGSGGVFPGGSAGNATGGSATGGRPSVDAGPDARPDGPVTDSGPPPIDAGPDGFVDPGCPDAAPPEPQEECDAFDPSSCGPGFGCYPFVQYPSEPCGQEIYGTTCQPAGQGEQGQPCGGSLCAPGFVCVISGVGNQCVQVCSLEGDDDCPPGLFCVPIDVEGFGACF